MVVEPRMQLLGLCSFDARRKSRFLVLGAEKKRSRRKKKIGGRKKIGGAENVLEGVEKVIWPPNTLTRRRRKKKQTIFFRLGSEKYDFRPPKEQRPSNFLSRPS